MKSLELKVPPVIVVAIVAGLMWLTAHYTAELNAFYVGQRAALTRCYELSPRENDGRPARPEKKHRACHNRHLPADPKPNVSRLFIYVNGLGRVFRQYSVVMGAGAIRCIHE